MAAGVHDVHVIAAAVGADPDALGRLLRYLCTGACSPSNARGM
jgi:hypothetical protein